MSVIGISLYCLLAVTAWTLCLTIAVVLWRGVLTLRGDFKANQFPHGTPHGSDRYWRVNRAHMNALENLPLVATVILIGAFFDVETVLFALWAQIYLGARIAQSLFHIASNHVAIVYCRFTAFFIQLVCLGGMIVEIIRKTGDL